MDMFSHLYKNTSFIIAKGNIVRTFKHGHAPNPFQAIVQGTFKSVGVCLPNADCT